MRHHRSSPHPSVAVLGGGAAGIATAYELMRRGVPCVLFEASPRLGGNCARVRVPSADGRDVDVDLGVSDYNRATFHCFDAFLRELGVATRPIVEDASVVDADGRTVWTTRGGCFRAAGSARDAAALEAEVRRFVAEAPEALASGRRESLGEHLAREGYSASFRAAYARPRAGGCIVMPAGDPDAHDMAALVRFWRQHGLVGAAPRARRHVVGGMAAYCEVFARWFRARGGRVVCGARVERVTRDAGGVTVSFMGPEGGRRERFAHVVVAVDPSRVAGIVDAGEREQQALRSLRYAEVEVVVHRDARVMPRDRDDWAAYQFYTAPWGERREGPRITFYPHRLAGVVGAEEVFVTLGAPVEIREELLVARRRMVHPVAAPTASRPELFARVQGAGGLWYAGAWLEAPWLHEQAFRAGRSVAEAIVRATLRAAA